MTTTLDSGERKLEILFDDGTRRVLLARFVQVLSMCS
jgi:hypothetical protein